MVRYGKEVDAIKLGLSPFFFLFYGTETSI